MLQSSELIDRYRVRKVWRVVKQAVTCAWAVMVCEPAEHGRLSASVDRHYKNAIQRDDDSIWGRFAEVGKHKMTKRRSVEFGVQKIDQ
jgi:hypothetical protein